MWGWGHREEARGGEGEGLKILGYKSKGKDNRKADGIIWQFWPIFLMKSKKRQQIKKQDKLKLNVNLNLHLIKFKSIKCKFYCKLRKK